MSARKSAYTVEGPLQLIALRRGIVLLCASGKAIILWDKRRMAARQRLGLEMEGGGCGREREG